MCNAQRQYDLDINTRDAPENFLLVALRVFALSSVVVAAPTLDVLGTAPTFFVAHHIDGFRLVVFAVVVELLPALVLVAFLALIRLIAPRLMLAFTATTIGGLVALIVVPTVDHELHMSTAIFVVATLMVTTAIALAYHRWRDVRTYLTLLAPVPVLLLALFLFVSPASVLVGGTQGVAASILRGSHTPVVIVVFDEFPLGMLLDERGTIDAQRFPGFARLGSQSTWYPKAVTVAPWTHLAVPAILTGQLPSSPVPVAATHPHSLFTLLGQSHRVHATEQVTALCPTDLCESGPADAANTAADTAIVFLHSLLPDDLARDWLPPLGERWANFADDPAASINDKPTNAGKAPYDDYRLLELYKVVSRRDEQLGSFANFVSSIGPGGHQPGLWFDHTLLPHLPYRYLPDGRIYADASLPAQGEHDVWVADQDLVANAAQRLALQTSLVDHLLTGMLDRLESQGMLDDALIVVTADHGVTLEPGRGPRGTGVEGTNVPVPLTARTRDELLPVPLFIKYPGQASGKVDDRNAQTIDILPTIADALGLDRLSGWRFDGRSLLSGATGSRPYSYTQGTDGKGVVHVRGRIDARQMTAYFRSILGPSGGAHDLYGIEPYAALIGTPAPSALTGPPAGTFTLNAPGDYTKVNVDGVVPALLQASVTGLTNDDWVAIAVNGTIAGTGPVYRGDDGMYVIAMLDPSLIRNGSNDITAYRIESLTSLVPLTSR